MAHLWATDDAWQWAVLPLEGGALDLRAIPPRAAAPEDHGGGEAALLVGCGAAGWALLAGAAAGVSVNGLPLVTGIRALRDRDEVRIGEAEPVFFSTESLAAVEPFPGAGRAIFCPRCKQEIPVGARAVRCPQCGVWHHQTEELPCFSYAPTCGALCPQKTELGAGFQWTPEEM